MLKLPYPEVCIDNGIYGKIKYLIYAVNNVKHNLYCTRPLLSVLLLYNAIFLPYLNYCSDIWGHITAYYKEEQ